MAVLLLHVFRVRLFPLAALLGAFSVVPSRSRCDGLGVPLGRSSPARLPSDPGARWPAGRVARRVRSRSRHRVQLFSFLRHQPLGSPIRLRSARRSRAPRRAGVSNGGPPRGVAARAGPPRPVQDGERGRRRGLSRPLPARAPPPRTGPWPLPRRPPPYSVAAPPRP